MTINIPRIAVIGGGHLGRIHAKLLAACSECELVCVADPDPQSRQLVESQLGLQTIADYQRLDGKVDGVIIAAPTFLHETIGSWCLSQGIHCFVEKPIASTNLAAERMITLAKRHSCTLQVGHVERFNPVWVQAQELLKNDSIRFIEATREGTYTGRSTDIGVVLDLMIHDLDLILSLVDSLVVGVRAYGWSVLGANEDFAVAHLSFKNGCLAQVRASRISETQRRAMQIFSDSGTYQLDFAAGTITQNMPHSDVLSGERQADRLSFADRIKVKDTLYTEWITRTELKPVSANAIAAEHSEFLNAIRYGNPVTVSGTKAANAMRTAEEILDAIQRFSVDRNILPGTKRMAA